MPKINRRQFLFLSAAGAVTASVASRAWGQSSGIDGSGRIQSANHTATMMGREGQMLTVNGQVKPNLSVATGGLLRLRFLNASPSRFYRLSLENHPFHLITTDGGALGKPVEREQLLLVPGEQAEVLVRGEKTKTIPFVEFAL